MIDALLNGALRARMAWIGATRWRAFQKKLDEPAAAQARALADILASGAETRFGRENGFARIRDLREYAEVVPVQTYEMLRPLIEAQERTGEPTLNRVAPVMYTQTSGTTGAPKLVPVMEETLAFLARDQALQTSRQYAFDPRAFTGKLLFVASPAVEGRLPSGTPYGSASGHVAARMPAAARAKYLLPSEVSGVGDYDLKYQLIVRLALGRGDVTAMGAANPSTFLRLHQVVIEHRDQLAADVSRGTFARLDELAPEVRERVSPRLAVDARRAATVREALADPEPAFEALWPGLRILTTWTGGSCAVALEALRPLLPATTHVCELGYLASECRGTLNVAPAGNLCVPIVDENVYEFVEVGRVDAGELAFVGLEALEAGREYHVYVTTRAGLYRYFMNDVVHVTGRFRETPTIAFVRKGRGVTNITGEKLHEDQVLQAVTTACRSAGSVSPFYLMLADVEHARYRLLIERPPGMPDLAGLDTAVDAGLGEYNVEYREKRASGRLGPLEVVVLSAGAGEAYKRACVAHGQRESQFKVQVLQVASECEFDFEPLRFPR